MSPRFVLKLEYQSYGLGAQRWVISDRRGILPDLALANVLDAEFVLRSLNFRNELELR